jgi:hypothetical protein
VNCGHFHEEANLDVPTHIGIGLAMARRRFGSVVHFAGHVEVVKFQRPVEEKVHGEEFPCVSV